MHWIDIGGTMVGSCSLTTATEIFQEGLRDDCAAMGCKRAAELRASFR
jgi:N-methylhydantoinase B/oxoprolinase/acetone carboxylase alpha subunit